MAKTREHLKDFMSGLLVAMEAEVVKAVTKATISDFIRLIQFMTDLEDDEPPREVAARWIDPLRNFDTGG